MIKNNKLHILFISFSFGIMSACGPINGANNNPISLSHKDMENNYGNNAIACHMPIIKNQDIFCKYSTRFAHHTLTFTELKKIAGQNYKLQYKLRFDEKNGQSCLNYSSINDEKIKIYKSKNNYAEIKDDDILIDGDERKIFADELLKKYSNMAETCGKYILFTTNEPKMTYKIQYIQIVDKLEVQDKNQPNELSIFSSGTKLQFAE